MRNRIIHKKHIVLALIICLATPLSIFAHAQKYEALLGIWDVQTEDGQYTFEFNFSLKEGELVGLFTGQAGETEMEDLTFEDNKVVFLVNIDAGGQGMAIDFEATIDGDLLEGMLALEFGEANIEGKKRKE
jgi:hypothetical protein